MAMNQPTNDDRRLVSIENQGGLIPSQSEWKLMRDMAATLLPTGFLPDSIKTPEQCVAIMLKGREIRASPMYALSNIAIIKGKPTIGAEMLLALIYRDHGKSAIRVKSSTNEACTVEYRLAGWDDVSSYSFTMDDAKKAGLIKAGPWQQYPAAMLRARCISAVARMAFPECIAGMFVPGELGDDVQVTDDGEVVSATGRVVDHGTGEITESDKPTFDEKWESYKDARRASDANTTPPQTREDRPRQPIEAEVVESPVDGQQSLENGTEQRDKANARAHAVAQGLFGKTGHDVLHVMAELAWGYDSLTKCTADDLNDMAKRLETKSPEDLDAWYVKWIAPRMPETVDDEEADTDE